VALVGTDISLEFVASIIRVKRTSEQVTTLAVGSFKCEEFEHQIWHWFCWRVNCEEMNLLYPHTRNDVMETRIESAVMSIYGW
jgi:hypothetical protein